MRYRCSSIHAKGGKKESFLRLTAVPAAANLFPGVEETRTPLQSQAPAICVLHTPPSSFTIGSAGCGVQRGVPVSTGALIAPPTSPRKLQPRSGRRARFGPCLPGEERAPAPQHRPAGKAQCLPTANPSRALAVGRVRGKHLFLMLVLCPAQ